MSWLSDMFGPPKKVDPNKVYGMMTSDGTNKMFERSEAMMDPNSPLNQAMFQNLNTAAADNTYVANRTARMNMAGSGMSGQSGVLNALQSQNANQGGGQVMDQWKQYMMNQLQGSNNLLTQATQNDINARQGMASAYGQNITNRNNYNSAMAGNAIKLGAMMLSDIRLKKDIKRLGTLNNGLGIYSYKYEGKDRTSYGVIAQEVEGLYPDAVVEVDGIKHVDYRRI